MSDSTYDNTCPHCGHFMDPTDIPWPVANNYVEFECGNCEKGIWAESECTVRIGKLKENNNE